MKISVYIPAYNAADFLAEAVESVLAQTRPADELLIVDDASTDRTAELIRAYAARYPRLIRPIFRAHNGGVSAARNEALAAATGDVLTYVDADDRFLPRKLEREAAALESTPGACMAFSDYYNISEGGVRGDAWAGTDPVPEGDVFLPLAARQFPRRDVFRFELMDVKRARAVGGYDFRLRIFEDYDLRLRVCQAGRACFVREPLAERRRHTRGLSAASAREHWLTLRTIYAKHARALKDRGPVGLQAGRAFLAWAAPFARQAALQALLDPALTPPQRRIRAIRGMLDAARCAPDAVSVGDWYRVFLPTPLANRLLWAAHGGLPPA